MPGEHVLRGIAAPCAVFTLPDAAALRWPTPVLAGAFGGRWRIVEMEVWPDDYLDLIEPAHIAFEGGMD